jgi:hypothetical protein
MNWQQLFNLRGTNLWLIGANVGWNVIWALFSLFIGANILSRAEEAVAIVQVGLMVSAFIGPFLGGWLTGKVASDGRGPTYGVIGSLGSVMLILITLLPAGILGLMIAAVALAGGLNGGVFSEGRRRSRH